MEREERKSERRKKRKKRMRTSHTRGRRGGRRGGGKKRIENMFLECSGTNEQMRRNVGIPRKV